MYKLSWLRKQEGLNCILDENGIVPIFSKYYTKSITNKLETQNGNELVANGLTDIFIKTCHKDYIWLKYCLLSIKKFAKGFRNVVIVSDTGEEIPKEYVCIPCNIFYVDLPKKQPTFVEHGIGYLWQQYIKLTWYNYTDANSVLILDSDEMFTKYVTPDSFKENEKFRWFYRDWKDAGDAICWKESTDFLLKSNTQYEAMCAPGYVFQLETSIALKNVLCSIHNTADIWDILVKYNMKKCSEFNMFGSFIHHFDRKEYVKMVNYHYDYINFSIRKSWSWGGLSNDEIKLREEILSS